MSRVGDWLEAVWEKHQGRRPDVESREERRRGLTEAQAALANAKNGAKMVLAFTRQFEDRAVDDLAPRIAEAFQARPRDRGRRRKE